MAERDDVMGFSGLGMTNDFTILYEWVYLTYL